MVLFQQGGSVNVGEMLQCISRQGFSVGQDQCPSEQDLSTFQQLTDETITEAWERLQDYISTCPITVWRSGSSSKASIMG
jgi:hypothetical protein